MKKIAPMFALVGVAGISAAQDTKPLVPAKTEKVRASTSSSRA